MGTTVIVPVRKTAQFQLERISTNWYLNDAHAFVLQRQDESLDEPNTPVSTNGAKAGCDPVVVTPIFERGAPGLLGP